LSPLKQPHRVDFADLTLQNVAGTDNFEPFGFKYYLAPKTDNDDNKITGFAPAKGKFVGCYYPVEQRAMGYTAVPPAKYVGPSDWAEKFPRRGKFGKYVKNTFTADIMKLEKERVGPNKYETSNLKRMRSPGNHKW
jgi:hypothetical protein